MHITNVQLKNFRCFEQATFDFDAPVVVIEGDNGSGKTSLLEALHYACYLRSFRTYSPQELLQFEHDTFFIKVTIADDIAHEVQVGFAGKKRLVKVDQRPVDTYKQLMEHYRTVTLTEDDVHLIKGSPEERRFFIDQVVLLLTPSFALTSKQFRAILENRTALLKKGPFSTESYELWSQQVWQVSKEIQGQRTRILQELQRRVQELVAVYFDNAFTISIAYASKMTPFETWASFLERHPFFHNEELRAGRSLIGAHLDDFTISWQDKKSRSYASRGQQKLIVLLLKMAQVQLLTEHQGPAVFLLDDFMTDFDRGRAQLLLRALIDLKTQLIFTSPESSFLNGQVQTGVHRLKLTR